MYLTDYKSTLVYILFILVQLIWL